MSKYEKLLKKVKEFVKAIEDANRDECYNLNVGIHNEKREDAYTALKKESEVL